MQPSKRAILLFVMRFMALLACGTYAYLSLSETILYARFLGLLARSSRLVVELLGVDVEVDGTRLIVPPVVTIDVSTECGAMLPMASYVAAVLAWPAPMGRRLGGILAGVLAIQAINVLRVASLVVLCSFDERVFRIAHEYVWESLLCALIATLWLFWVRSLRVAAERR